MLVSNKIAYPVLLLMIGILSFGYINAYCQPPNERTHIQCDKQLCQAGDTIWWKGYIIAGNHFSRNSTNLHVELFSDSKQLIDRELFPIINGQSIGQMTLPDSLPPGIYWLRFFTKYKPRGDSGDMPVIPITVYREQDKNPVFMKRTQATKTLIDPPKVALDADTLNVRMQTVTTRGA